MWIVEPGVVGERCCRREESTTTTTAGHQRILGRDCGRRRGRGRLIQMVLNLLSDVRPCAFNVLRHLRNGCPVVVDDAEGAANYGLIIDRIGEAESRTEVCADVIGDLASR